VSAFTRCHQPQPWRRPTPIMAHVVLVTRINARGCGDESGVRANVPEFSLWVAVLSAVWRQAARAKAIRQEENASRADLQWQEYRQ
jgi:hypothetical protein